MTSFASGSADFGHRTSRIVLGDPAEQLTKLSIWCVIIGGGLVREILGQTEVYGFGFITVHSIDPAIVLSGMAAILHLLRRRLAWHLYTVPILLITGLITLNAVRGIGVGPTQALLWMRANGGIATFLLLAVTMRPTLPVLKSARDALIVNAVALCVLLALRLVTSPTLFMTADFTADDANDGGRALSAFGTFLLVLASGLTATELLQRAKIVVDVRLLLTAAFPVAVLLTRQGTANLAEFVMLASIYMLQPGRGQRERLMLGGIIGSVAGALLFLVLPMVLADQEISHRADNLGTRRMAWDALITDWPLEPLFNQYFGMPAGQLPRILVLGKVNYSQWGGSMHSMYFGSLPMMGYVGAAAYVSLLLLLAFYAFRETRRRIQPISSFPFACVAATAVLSVSYEVRGESLMGLFMAIGWLRIAAVAREKKLSAAQLRVQLSG